VYIEKINYAVGDGYRLKSEALKYCTSLSAMFRSTNDLEPFAEKFCSLSDCHRLREFNIDIRFVDDRPAEWSFDAEQESTFKAGKSLRSIHYFGLRNTKESQMGEIII
jgi:hypothetical protein